MRLKLFYALAAALIVVAVAAMPALATGDHPGEHPSDHAGEVPDLGYDAPCLAIDLDEEAPRNPNCDDLPHFKSSFLNRVWTFRGAVDYFQNTDDHVLSITVEKIEKLPRRFRRQDDELIDQDASVLLSERTRVYDPDGYRIDHDLLEDADYVEVRAKLLRPRKWRANEDGEVVPTLRAKRIYVTEWSRRAGGGEVEEPRPEPEPEPEQKDCEVVYPQRGYPGYVEHCER
jgi:hypothetical protein